MDSIKPQKYYVEGMLTLDLSMISDLGRYIRLTLKIDEIYVSLFFEQPAEGVDKSLEQQFIAGFYIADHKLTKDGKVYAVCDALTEIGTLNIDDTV